MLLLSRLYLYLASPGDLEVTAIALQVRYRLG
jgi:hypothetical protein